MRSNISVFHDLLKNPSPELYQIYYICVFSAIGKQLIPFLQKLGLNCTEPQSNSTQGTVSTLIFFENVYLEIFWFEENSPLVPHDMEQEFNFQARVNWISTGASPFGFGLFYSTTNQDNFVPEPAEVIVISESPTSASLQSFCPLNLANPEEPICYFVPDYEAKRNRLDRSLAIAEETRKPGLGIRKLTHLKTRIISHRVITPPLIDITNQKLLEIEYKKHPLLELTFDDGNQQRLLDLRPLIPIVLRY